MLAENAMVRHAMSPKALFALPSSLNDKGIAQPCVLG